MSRNTISKLINAAQRHGYIQGVTDVNKLPDIIRQLNELASAESIPIRAPAQHELTNLHDDIAMYMQQPYMTVRQCLRLLVEQHQVSCSETSLHRYIKKYIDVTEQSVIPLPTRPGQQAQVDFGYVGKMYCQVTNKARKTYAFIMTLSHSRHRFVHFVFSQDSQTWVDCHRRAFEFFAGVPAIIVLDNLKAGVIKPDLYDPTINKTYAECEKHYGFVADPAKVRVAKHKGKVERSVTIVKQQVIAGRNFTDIQAACQQQLKIDPLFVKIAIEN